MNRHIVANGAHIPVIGLGTGRLKKDIAIQAIHAALAHGYDHIDTAAKYGNEIEVGEAIRTFPRKREDIFVTTKVMAPGLDGSEGNSRPEDSLKRLGLDYVDLLLLHWPNQETSLGQQLEVLSAAKRQGLARHIGVSNFPPAYVEAAARLSKEPLVANQVERHPFLDQCHLSTTCAAHGLALIAFSPMGRGVLLSEPTIVEIAAAYRRSPAQIILRWHLQQPLNAVVPSSTNPERIASNHDIFDFALTDDEEARITALTERGERIVKGPSGYDWNGFPKLD